MFDLPSETDTFDAWSHSHMLIGGVFFTNIFFLLKKWLFTTRNKIYPDIEMSDISTRN